MQVCFAFVAAESSCVIVNRTSVPQFAKGIEQKVFRRNAGVGHGHQQMGIIGGIIDL